MLHQRQTRIVWSSIMILGFWSNHAFCQMVGEDSRFATDSAQGQVFIHNPAAIYPNKTWITYKRSVVNSNSSVNGIVNDIPVNIEFNRQETRHGLGLLYPLGGGAAFGLSGQQNGTDYETTSENTTNPVEEARRVKIFSGRFILDITAKARAAFSYRVVEEKRSLLGNFNINENDRTKYTGKMAGYSVGVFYEDGNYGVGLGHSPIIRGKAEIQGEEKIVTDRGHTVLDFFYLDGKIKYGLVYKKYQYQRDDRSESATSLNDQRRISLNGLNLLQFQLDQELVVLGLDYPINNESVIRGSAARRKSLFLFDGELLPGDNGDLETPFTSNIYSVGLIYQKSEFKLDVSYSIHDFEIDSFRDSERWFGISDYEDYKSSQSVLSISIGFVN